MPMTIFKMKKDVIKAEYGVGELSRYTFKKSF